MTETEGLNLTKHDPGAHWLAVLGLPMVAPSACTHGVSRSLSAQLGATPGEEHDAISSFLEHVSGGLARTTFLIRN
jgi:hypothetical protein